MSQKNEMLEHPLFKDRRRVLVVPASTQTPVRKHGRAIMANLLVALLVLGVFLFGFWLSSPTNGDIIAQLPGQRWTNFMQHRFGTDVGKGLADQSPWILARVAGIVTYLLVFCSVTLGLLVSLRMTDRIFHRASIVYLHRIFSLSLLVFSALHIVGLLLDRYIKMDLAQMLIPFDTSYRPLWTGIGTLSLYGAVAVVVSFYLSGKLGYKLWRATHYLSFLVFTGGFMHGLMAGTDSKSSWMLTIYLITGFIVVFLTGTRFFVRTGVMHEISGG